MKIKNYIKCLLLLSGFVWISDLPAQKGWERMADMPEATSWYGSCVDPVSEKAYIFGGSGPSETLLLLTTTQIYDFKTDTWSLGANMPIAASAFSADMVNGKVYIIGEYFQPWAMTTVKEYDPVEDAWTEKGQLPGMFRAQGSCVYNGLIYLFGGGIGGSTVINTVRSYDPSTDTWDELADMPGPRMKSTVCIYEDEIYLFGGNPSLKYTPSSDSWNELNIGDYEMDGYSVPIIYGDTIFLFGGYKYGGNYPNPSNEIWAYYPALDTLKKLAKEMPFKRFTRGHAYNNYVYLFGGHFDNTLGSVTDEVWRLHLDSLQSDVSEYALKDNIKGTQFYPNPFSSSVTLEFELREPAMITTILYNSLGEIVAETRHGKLAGQQKIEWNCKGLPAGVYFSAVKSNNGMHIRKIIKLN